VIPKRQVITSCIGFEILTAVIMKSTIFWYTMPWSLLKDNVSEKHNITYIFRIEEYAEEETGVKAGGKQSSRASRALLPLLSC
jgi:hypothetical protein